MLLTVCVVCKNIYFINISGNWKEGELRYCELKIKYGYFNYMKGKSLI